MKVARENSRSLAPPEKLVDIGIPFAEQMDTAWQTLGSMPWNPEGTEVLFSKCEADGHYAIWRINIYTREETSVTSPPSGFDDLQASWSRDGTRIVFQRRSERSGILVQNMSDGAEAREVILDEFVSRTPAWAEDGEHIIFVSNRGDGGSELWMINESGARGSLVKVRSATSGTLLRHPSVSQAGRVAYGTWSHHTDIWFIHVDSLVWTQVTKNTADNFGAQYSANSSTIVFHSSQKANHEVWSYDIETKLSRNLTKHVGIDIYPDSGPKGEIVFVSNRDGAFNLWLMNRDGSKQRVLSDRVISLRKAHHYVGRSEGPRWSPDGKAIGYLEPAASGRTLVKVNLSDGSIEEADVGIHSFDWYLDSDRIVYSCNQLDSDGIELRAMNLQTRKSVPLIKDACGEIAVSADGTRMTYCRVISHFNSKLFALDLVLDPATKLPMPNGSPRPLTFGQGSWHVHNGGLSPDGSHAVFTKDTDEGDIIMLIPQD